MLTLPVLKAAGVVAVLYFLFKPQPASAAQATSTAGDAPPTTYPNRTSDKDPPPPPPGGQVQIIGGACTAGCVDTHMDCPGDPNCADVEL